MQTIFREEPKYVIVEKHLVLEGKEQQSIDYYKKWVLPVLYEIDGFLGMSVLSPNPEAGGIRADSRELLFLGPPEDSMLHHEGLRPDARARTDLSIHFDALLRGTYNLIFFQYLRDDAAFQRVESEIERRWQDRYGTDLWDELAANYFVNYRNHWDMVYRFVEQSLPIE